MNQWMAEIMLFFVCFPLGLFKSRTKRSCLYALENVKEQFKKKFSFHKLNFRNFITTLNKLASKLSSKFMMARSLRQYDNFACVHCQISVIVILTSFLARNCSTASMHNVTYCFWCKFFESARSKNCLAIFRKQNLRLD